MNLIKFATYFLAAAVFLFVWFPYTRIFLVGYAGGEILTTITSLLLCVGSVILYRKEKSKLSVITFIIGLSPVIFILLILIFAYFGLIPLAP